jgi:hypothetical protein
VVLLTGWNDPSASEGFVQGYQPDHVLSKPATLSSLSALLGKLAKSGQN